MTTNTGRLRRGRSVTSDKITTAGGLSAPIHADYDFLSEWCDYLTKAQRRRGWRRWLTWDKGWGFPLHGFVTPKLRDMLPMFHAQRGGIRFPVAQEGEG